MVDNDYMIGRILLRDERVAICLDRAVASLWIPRMVGMFETVSFYLHLITTT